MTISRQYPSNPPSTKPHYVDNKKFLAALIEYRQQVLEARGQEKEIPSISNYIGECFLKISNHLSYKSNFINYSYKEEMVSDAIENCMACVSNFDPAKSENPFAYFTQVCYFAFIRRIQKEQKQTKTKHRIIENMDIDSIISQEHGSGDNNSQFYEYIRKQLDFIDINRKLSDDSRKKIESTSGVLPIDID
jgi:hypothetical protein